MRKKLILKKYFCDPLYLYVPIGLKVEVVCSLLTLTEGEQLPFWVTIKLVGILPAAVHQK